MMLFALLSSLLCFAAETTPATSSTSVAPTLTTNLRQPKAVDTKNASMSEEEATSGLVVWLLVGGLFAVAVISFLMLRGIRYLKAKEAREEDYMFKNDTGGPKIPVRLADYPQGFNVEKSFGPHRTNKSLQLARTRSLNNRS
eukprot:GEMP01047733.1.p1 GENE.GEMP01047733.1~~GEMP01047733.1.p1  ORF type:complete len:142 (+),score=25.23 GEMP01047733.1:161-586(+)